MLQEQQKQEDLLRQINDNKDKVSLRQQQEMLKQQEKVQILGEKKMMPRLKQ